VPIAILAALDAYAAAFLAALLLASAAHKAISRDRLLRSVRDLTGLPDSLSWLALAAAGGFEFTAGLALAVPATRAVGGFAAAVLWSGYLCLLLLTVRAGRDEVDCGCSFGRGRAPLGHFQFGRNAALITIALCVAAAARFTPPMALRPLEVLGGLAFLTLYAALDASAQSATWTR